jgi:raffinose/stachyose/melibiose transport system permease protein
MSRRKTQFIGSLVVTVASLLSLYPVVYIMMISLKSKESFLMSPNTFPDVLRFDNYVRAWSIGRIGILGVNTLIVTFISIITSVLIGIAAGYAMEKLIKGKRTHRFLYNYFVAGIIIPFQVIMLPLFKILRTLGLFNSLRGMVIVYTVLNLPFAVFLFCAFVRAIPNELLEAARIDGCSAYRIFGSVIIPLSRSIIITVAIFVGIYIWKDFSVPLVYVSHPLRKTLSIGLLAFKNEYNTNWPVLAAAMVIQTFPVLLGYIVAQKQFIEGITGGSVKG